MKKATKLSVEPYKGVRDFYPRDMFVQNYIFDTMREVAERFGYQEYSASILEPTELYEAKSSEEIVSEQTYTFEDRGGRSVTLRPEMTPSVARMVAAKRRELAFPLRLYSIPNVFRYERPQRGRLREHWQLNCDLFGVTGTEAEVEIINIASEIMKAFGAGETDFEIRISDRRILENLYDEIGLSQRKQAEMTRLLDRRDKIENFHELALELLGAGEKENLLLAELDKFDSDTRLGKHIEQLKRLGMTNARVDANVVRGFDYYTGTVFEVFDTSPENNRSLFGGGRYDNLLDVFEQGSVPAVGFGMGDVTIRDFLETHKLLPEFVSSTDVCVCVFSKAELSHAQTLAAQLRNQGLNVAVDFSFRKIGDQLKAVDKHGIRFAIPVGGEEIASGQYKLKDLKTGEETVLSEKQIGDFIWTHEV